MDGKENMSTSNEKLATVGAQGSSEEEAPELVDIGTVQCKYV